MVEQKILDRFLIRTKHVKPDKRGCLVWPGAKSGSYRGKLGPGSLNDGSKTWNVARLSFEIFVGPIRNGMELCHACDNPPCFNPNHLFIGTHMDNMRDMGKKGRRTCKLSVLEVDEIRQAKGRQRDIAVLFGVTQPLVSLIKNGLRWSSGG